MSKISNGIIGITRNETARDRFCITWCESSLISENTKTCYTLEDSDNRAISTRKEGLPSKQKEDGGKVEELVKYFAEYKLFYLEAVYLQSTEPLGADIENEDAVKTSVISLYSKDVASIEISDDLITSKDRGVALTYRFIKERPNTTICFYIEKGKQ